MAEELQKDPMSRGKFLYLGAVGTGVGIMLTVPPVIYVLSPSIKSVLLKESDVPQEWKELGSVFEIPAEEPKVYLVEFDQRQTFDAGQPGAVREGDNVGVITNAVLVSWKDGKLPSLLENSGEEEPLESSEIDELTRKLNVMNNACAHMGCPVRWSAEEKEILCPCHGGIYDINGKHTGGPPPHGLWNYTFEIREDGTIYVKHDMHVEEIPGEKPYVV